MTESVDSVLALLEQSGGVLGKRFILFLTRESKRAFLIVPSTLHKAGYVA